VEVEHAAGDERQVTPSFELAPTVEQEFQPPPTTTPSFCCAMIRRQTMGSSSRSISSADASGNPSTT
jgi:hypothetical protein